MNSDAIDPAAFAHLREITGYDLVFLDELIDTYLEDGETQLEAMAAAGSADDAEAMIRPAHSLKSSSANVGATGLTELCRALEADVLPDHPERGGSAQRLPAVDSTMSGPLCWPNEQGADDPQPGRQLDRPARAHLAQACHPAVHLTFICARDTLWHARHAMTSAGPASAIRFPGRRSIGIVDPTS